VIKVRLRGLKIVLNVIFMSVMLGAPVLAAAPEISVNQAADIIWVLVTAFLVFFMQAGFAMVETGFTRAKNAGNIIMKNLMDFSIGSIAYWAVGFSLMFGVGSFIGKAPFFLGGAFAHLGLNIPLPVFLLFQTVFAATAATIVSGAMAERTKFISYLIYSAVISLVIYPVVGHWAWGGGWLSKLGFIDFAGSTVVHSVGGWAALIGATVLGPRIGKYGPDGKTNAIPGHNLVIAALGVFILWFGWFGFNPGSTLSPFAPNLGMIAVTTNLAAAAGALLALVVSWFKYGKPDVSMTLNGALAGLVGITAGCASVSPTGSILIGAIVGSLVIYAVEFFDKVKVDDPVGAISVHGVCGAAGTLLVGLFATDGGLFYGGGARLLGIQAIGVGATFVWTALTCAILFLTLKHTVGLRVKEIEEIEGLDIHEHTSYAYADLSNTVPKYNQL
jgi:Amt family ammonium transporter